LLWICCIFSHQSRGQTLTLSAGYNTLPKKLFGAFVAKNSQNELVIIGGCAATTSSISHGCSNGVSNTYSWDISNSAVFTEQSASISSSFPSAWSPSIGYPFPIYNDIMFIAYYDALYKYDTINKAWLTDTSSAIPVPLYYPCTVYDAVEQKIYLLGGYLAVDNTAQLFGSVQIYDIQSDSWQAYTSIAQMPFSVYGGSCVLTEERVIYHFGGRVSGGTSKAILKYEIDNNQWTQLSTMVGEAIFGASTVLVNDTYIFLFGGGRFGGSKIMYTTSSVYLFRTHDESIELVASMNEERYAPLSAVVNNQIYVAGGAYTSLYSLSGVWSDTLMSIEKWKDESYVTSSTVTSTTTTTTKTDVSGQTDSSQDSTSSSDSAPAAGEKDMNQVQVINDLVIAVVVLSLVIVLMIAVFIVLCRYFKCIRKSKVEANMSSAKQGDKPASSEDNKKYQRVNKYSVDMDGTSHV